ncbi:MAG: NHLP family bacteriocin export ABC transporter peptidase/permease/ATPase subunit [Lachnospiraceae bacterium]|nr:NHLP family bacteriocin export ABC transporter peptidase/permease/ATPase subunit [Lachnospiraceae bacterium]
MSTNPIKKPVTGKVAKVPVVMQMEALECGAASLCMILAYYGKWVPLEQARSDCGVSRDGSNAKNILVAARNYGLDAQGYRVEPEELREEGSFPCIVHWEFNHFVVCNGFKGNKVYLNDPARGNIVVSKERFDEAFTGIVIMFEPGDGFVADGKPKSVVEFARTRLKGSSSAVAFVVITSVIASLTGIITAGFSRVFLDRLLTGKDPDWIPAFFAGMVAVTLITIVSSWIQAVYSLRLNGKMDAVGNCSYMWKVLRLPMEFFKQRMSGDIQLRKLSNASIAATVINTVAPLVIQTVMMIIYLVIMIRYSLTLTCIGVASVLINACVSKYISGKRINIMRVMMRDEGKLEGTAVSGIDMIETIKSGGSENGFFEKWSGYQASVNTQNVRYIKQDAMLGLIPLATSSLTNALILILGVWYAMQGSFTVGMIFAFQTFMMQFLAPVQELIGAGQTIQEMRTSMERVEDVMQYPEDPVFSSTGSDDDIRKLSGNLSMKHVTFGYSKLSEPIITDFNLELKPGQRVAIVGETGCGKSTVAKLISGLNIPWDGEILFDGKKITQIDRRVFTGSVAVVDQDIIMFEDSISDNITMWDSSIMDFEVILAARDAGIHDDIMRRKDNYHYRINEGGKDFSGGQRQRLEIARVLAQDPTMIIMDEATSALDAKTEFEVTQAIKDRGITCVIIAHRLSTIRDCDEIIVLDHGKVVQRGTHDELIKAGGAYKELVISE